MAMLKYTSIGLIGKHNEVCVKKEHITNRLCQKMYVRKSNLFHSIPWSILKTLFTKKHKASYAIGFPCIYKIYSGFQALLLKKLNNFLGQPIDIRQKPKNKARSEIYHRFEDPARLKLFAPHNL